MLKADFHIHTKEDLHDYFIKHSAEEFIKQASLLGFEVLAITNHNRITYNKTLFECARNNNILLIPGIEINVEGKHVVVLNATEEIRRVTNFAELREFKKNHPDIFVLAPHPFYPNRDCLRKLFFKYHDLFDGIEYCHYYFKLFNRFNRKAVKAAERYKKPLIGTSDAHQYIQFNKTYSLVDSAKDTISVIEALKKGKVRLVTTHLSLFRGIKVIKPMLLRRMHRFIHRLKNKITKLL